MEPIRTVFIGTSEEGVSSLEGIIAHKDFDVVGVVTQPDKPVGRKQELTPTPIKTIALSKKIKLYTPQNKLQSYKDMLEETDPELIVTIAFGEFLPRIVIDYPKYKCINIHYSLLPQLRGAVPVQMAILEGLEKTGVTIQIMEVECDTGPILAQKEISIEPKDTTPTLKEKLIESGQNLLIETLVPWVNGKITPTKQKCDCPEYCFKKDISKENAEIDWERMDPEYIERMVRALLPWPVAWTTHNGKRIKIYEAELAELNIESSPGEIIIMNKEIYFTTKDPNKSLKVTSLQPEGKNIMKAEQFICGWKGKGYSTSPNNNDQGCPD
ncbi:methionyl-tRNA formyltransferase [Candidatus Dojkabacteria bacterium]|nr:methionyl-tRNA formyltransferase [Candidatus Dojkabacteria bacterium]